MTVRTLFNRNGRRGSILPEGYADVNGINGIDIPSNITTYAAHQVFVDSPQDLSRRQTGISNPPSNASPNGNGMFNVQLQPLNGSRKWSQQDQDIQDEHARQKAMKELVGSWMDRLQLISVITTFFAAIESQLLGIVTPDDPNDVSHIQRASAAALSSSLVIHIFAAILSFGAAFFLVRFRVHEANRQEHNVEAHPGKKASSSDKPKEGGGDNNDVNSGPDEAPIWSANPRLEQVGPFRKGNPPTHLLEICHTLCMVFSVLGFFLAMVGVVCYAWAMLPISSQILCTVSIGACLVVSIITIFMPQRWSPFAPIHVIDNSGSEPPY